MTNDDDTEESLTESLSQAYDELENKDSDSDDASDGDEVAQPAKETEGEEVEEGQEAATEVTEEVEAVDAPHSWRADEKELFKSLPPQLQKQISEREMQRERVFTQRTTELSQKLKQYGELDEIFQPYATELEARGATPAQVVRQLVAIQKMMDDNPKETISRIAAGYGLTPEEFLIQQSQAGETNPQMKQVLTELNALKASIAQREEQGVLQQRQAYEDSMTQQEISTFAEGVDATGKPARPYFQQVMPQMIPLVNQLRSTYPEARHSDILHEAYNQAVWINPVIRQKMIIAETTKTQGVQKQTDRAKKAAVSVSGNPAGGSAVSVDPKSSFEDDLRASWEELT